MTLTSDPGGVLASAPDRGSHSGGRIPTGLSSAANVAPGERSPETLHTGRGNHPPSGVSPITRNLTWLILTQMATWAISIVVLIVAPRSLGDDRFGELTFALTYVGFFQLVALLGTGTYLIKSVARDHDRVGPYVFNAAVLKVALCFALSSACLALGWALDYSNQTLVLVALGCVGMTTVVLNDVLVAGLQGMERMARTAMWGVVEQYIIGGLGIAVLLTHRGLTAYAVTLTCFGIISLIPNSMLLWPHLRQSLRIDFGLWRRIAAGGVPYFFTAAIVLIYGTIDIWLLETLT